MILENVFIKFGHYFNWMKSDIGQMSISGLSYSWLPFGNSRQYPFPDVDEDKDNDESRYGRNILVISYLVLIF